MKKLIKKLVAMVMSFGMMVNIVGCNFDFMKYNKDSNSLSNSSSNLPNDSSSTPDDSSSSNPGGTETPDQPGSGGTETPDQPGSGGTETPDQPGSGGTETPDQPGSGGTETPDQPGSGGTETPDQPGSGGTENPDEPQPSPALAIPDFIVEVEEGRDPVILQLTDTQIVDASQERTSDRLGSSLDAYWAKDQIEERCYDYLTETITTVNPDLIIMTGDLVYGEFDDAGTSLLNFIEFMESFDIPWAPVFGNHEAESTKGVDWQCDQLEAAENCLFKQRTLTGNGNYSVGIEQGGQLKRVFFMLDSNGSSTASSKSLSNNHTKKDNGFGTDQIAWFTQQAQEIHALSADTNVSFAFHIQPAVFSDAFAKYGYSSSNLPINIDTLENKASTDFGYIGRTLKGSWDGNYKAWNAMVAAGADSIFVGHEHCNSASVVYQGVRLQYGQKSSTYDRANYADATTGLITGSYSAAGTPMVGGTVIPLSKDSGEIVNPYIYLCKSSEEFATGVTEYTNSKLTISGNTVSANGVTQYAEGSRVAIRAKNNKGVAVKMYANDGTTKLSASEIYTDDGKVATTLSANTWYTYIFYIDSAMTVGAKAGKMIVDSTAGDLTAEYSGVYIIKDKFAGANFKFTMFDKKGASGIGFWHAYNVSRRSSADCGKHTQNEDGTILLESTGKADDLRRYYLDDQTKYTAGTYLVWKLKYEDVAPSACFYDANGNAVDCVTWYDADKNPLSSVGTAQKGQWVYAVWRVSADIAGDITDNASSATPGTFTLVKGATEGTRVVIGGAYVMTGDGYKAFFGLN